jgi:hypothetical protein
MRKEGYIGVKNLKRIFEARFYLIKTMMDIWDIPIEVAFNRFIYYNIDAIIKKVREIKGNEEEPWKNSSWIVRKVIENREKIIERLEKFKRGEDFLR